MAKGRRNIDKKQIKVRLACKSLLYMVIAIVMFTVIAFNVSTAFAAYTWTEQSTSGVKNFTAIASSSDGTKLAAIDSHGYIYTSTDSGVTWTKQTNTKLVNGFFIASSSDGTKLAAAEMGGYIYTSTDSGGTWTKQAAAGLREWWGIASSSDGTKLAAAEDDGYIYTSTDSGVTWTKRTAQGVGIASSADGTKLFAISAYAFYTSTDSGVTWTKQDTSAGPFCDACASRGPTTPIASSSDGTKLAAFLSLLGGYIYTSTDSGVTWTAQTASGNRVWNAIASSSDGTTLIACERLGYVYVSNDSGVTWNRYIDSNGSNFWSSVASSADGTKLAAAEMGGGYIWTTTAGNGTNPTPTPTVNDTTPHQFTFTNFNSASLNTTYTSNTIKVTDINAATPISITGGTYKINNGNYTSDAGTVNNGDTVTVQLVSSESYATTTNAKLTIGGVSDTFSVITIAADDDNGSGDSSDGHDSVGGCFIATAAFGSPMAKQVEVLRQFRDMYLLTNALGKKFVSWYYRNGPLAANFIKDKPFVKAVVRVALYPLIGFSYLLITGYLPTVTIGFLLSVLLFLRFRPQKLIDR